jgi:two-component system response regulator MprA
MAGRILVIEDDEHVLETVTDMLQSGGHEVIGLRFPDLALDVVAHERPDLILLDVMLSKTSGIDVADRLWLNGFGTTPLVAMSASIVMTDLARQTPFFQAVMRKPFDIDRLLAQVSEVLSEDASTLALPLVEHSPASRARDNS